MKRILYITTIDKTINAFLVPHIKKLIEEGNVVDVACNIEKEKNSELIDNRVRYHQVDFSRNPLSLNNKNAMNQIKEIQKQYKYDVIHVHTPVASFVTRYALRKENVTMVYTCHGFHFYDGAPLINWLVYYNLEKIAAKWTDRIITINNEDFERAKKFELRNNKKDIHLMHGVGIKKEDYVIENFDRESYREDLGIDKDDFMILILAEINKNKNHIQIIKAMEKMRDKENIKVICAGDGPLLEKHKKYISEKGLERNIKFIGFRNDVKELLNSCDCVGLFSKREGLGKCLLEGMILDKKIIATKSRGAKTLIDNQENTTLINIGDIEQSKQVLGKLLFNKNTLVNNKIFTDDSKRKYLLENVLKNMRKYNK